MSINVHNKHEKCWIYPIEIVDLPIDSMVSHGDFPELCGYVYQRVASGNQTWLAGKSHIDDCLSQNVH